MKIGVFALQGDFEKHARVLESLGVQPLYVSNASQLAQVEGLIIPGGESTTILKLLESESLIEPLTDFAQKHPILGTCAGAILMAAEVTSPSQPSLGLIDMTVERNAYGRQLDSSIRRLQPGPEFEKRAGPGELEVVFIRAPIIRRVGERATILLNDGANPILVEQGGRLAATFHPELTDDSRIHRLFLDKVQDSRKD